MTTNPAEQPCPVCGGFGVVTRQVPIDHPNFGKTFPCPHCNIAALRRRDSIQRMSNLDHYEHKTFDSFQTQLSWLSDAEQQSLGVALNMAETYAKEMAGWLIFIGSPGVGKTHLAAAIANEAVARSIRTIFATAPDLLDYLRATFAPESELQYAEKFDQMKNIDLLVIDDLGAESSSQWAQEKLYQLLNHRSVSKLATVITTNIPEDQFEQRIASRVLDMSVGNQVRLYVPDYRRRGKVSTNADKSMELTSLVRYKRLTFDNFQSAHDPRLEKITRFLKGYASQPQDWLVLLGDSGVGKTHLAAALANHANHLTNNVMMANTPDLIDFLQATFGPTSATPFISRFDEIRRAPLLVLDDFGLAERASEWLAQKMFQLIDYRYLTELPTVLTINPRRFSILKKHYPEIHSRLTDTRLVEILNLGAHSFRRSPSSSDF